MDITKMKSLLQLLGMLVSYCYITICLNSSIMLKCSTHLILLINWVIVIITMSAV